MDKIRNGFWLKSAIVNNALFIEKEYARCSGIRQAHLCNGAAGISVIALINFTDPMVSFCLKNEASGLQIMDAPFK